MTTSTPLPTRTSAEWGIASLIAAIAQLDPLRERLRYRLDPSDAARLDDIGFLLHDAKDQLTRPIAHGDDATNESTT